MTNRNASDDSIADRIASGNTSVSSMPAVSIQTFLPLDSIASARRVTNDESCREYETKTSAIFPRSGRHSTPSAAACIAILLEVFVAFAVWVIGFTLRFLEMPSRPSL